MQDEIEYEKEILEIEDSTVEFLAPFHLTDLQLAEKCSQQIKREAYRTSISAPDPSRPQYYQPYYRQQCYQPPRHRVTIVHDQQDQSCNQEKIGEPDIPSDSLELSWVHNRIMLISIANIGKTAGL